MNDPEAEKKDRLLATFAMGISNLAIINVLGEGIKEMTEILQIAVVTMTRLERADITPNIMLVQHLLTEKNCEKLTESEEQFCKAVRRAIDLAEEKDVHVGVRSSKCLDIIFQRIETGTLLKQFHPYKDGATANAALSESYHNDAVNLYDEILQSCKSSNTPIEFQKWSSHVLSYWECVKQENFALRFKNIKEIYDFIDRGERITLLKQAMDAAFGLHSRQLIAKILTTASTEAGIPLKYRRDELVKQIEDIISRIPCNSSAEPQADEDVCKDVIDRKSSLYEHVRDQPWEYETQQTIEKYANRVHDSTQRKLCQSLDAMIMRQGCCVEFDTILTKHLKLCLTQKGAGEFSSEERQEITHTIFESLKGSAQNKDKDMPVRDKVLQELVQEYVAIADIHVRFEQRHCMFEEILDAESYFTWACNKFIGHRTEKEKMYLKCSIENLPTKLLERRQADCFEDGMVRELSHMINDTISNFSKKCKLSPEEKTKIHVWVQQLFYDEIQELQRRWDKKNKVSSILNDNKERYMEIINARLDCGFNCVSEGKVIGLHLTNVMRHKAINAENMARTRAVEGIVWTTNSEKIRLKYFKEIATHIVDGNKEVAMKHIVNPRKQIEEWYKEEVDRHGSAEYYSTFRKTIHSEYKAMHRSVCNASGITEIIHIAQTYSSETITSLYQPSCGFSDPSNPEELNMMRSVVTDTMAERKDVISQFDESEFSKPSQSREVMARLGCIHTCYWCGALCWGQRGHDENTDETRKHHSSHQPIGLDRSHDKHRKCLGAEACHDILDEDKVWFGKYLEKDEGITWKHAKEEHFSDWKFDRHYITKFDELMRWFFQELHQDIACLSEDLKPATKEDLKKYNCLNLSYNDIIARVEQEID